MAEGSVRINLCQMLSTWRIFRASCPIANGLRKMALSLRRLDSVSSSRSYVRALSVGKAALMKLQCDPGPDFGVKSVDRQRRQPLRPVDLRQAGVYQLLPPGMPLNGPVTREVIQPP